MLPILLISLYTAALAFVFLNGLVQLHLVYYYRKFHRHKKKFTKHWEGELPIVTVQLPIYNERYVAERLIDAVAAFDHPKEKFEIQVLDDSTDDTAEIIARKVQEWQQQELDIKHVRRPQRIGFKAGALQYGMERSRGEFIAIFDADFLPAPDFLQQTLPHLQESQVGMVQTRWGHINKDYSLLTRLQAFALDAHFTVEQLGRSAAGAFINFNGTAGVWRKRCIEDAGGWQHDTLTEDLDLSYRAQLKGWQFRYLEDVETPAELPAVVSAVKSQQYRWAKGAAETARKTLPTLLLTKMPLIKKVHAFFHLMGGGIFLSVLLLAVLSVPVLFLKNVVPGLEVFFLVASFFLLGILFLMLFYYTSLQQQQPSRSKRIGYFLLNFPLFLCMAMGISFHNAIAAAAGFAGRKSTFIRTPKFNISSSSDGWKENIYLSDSLVSFNWPELLLICYFGGAVGMGFYYEDYGLLPMHLGLVVGFVFLSYYSVTQNVLKR